MSVAIQTTQLRQRIQAFEFQNLFLEELGWDHHRGASVQIPLDGKTYTLRPFAQKRGLVVYLCEPEADGALPDYVTRGKIQKQLAKLAREHLIIYVDHGLRQQIWLWVKHEQGKPDARREHQYHRGQSGEPLAQRLRELAFSLEEEEQLGIVTVTERVRKAFDVERVTKRFYDRFQKEHDAFLKFIQGIPDQGNRTWYASLMLNRLMFTYFIQKKEFLNGETDYLSRRLELVQQQLGRNQFHSFYRSFLVRLFHEGLGQPQSQRSPELEALIGDVPYLNGGLFEQHQIEKTYQDIEIPDEAFERVFAFFDEYRWHLDERPLRADNEINPDVLGYIFEKYINQKQMGAYYTKEDITGHISKNTILPFLFDAARPDCIIAFQPGGEVWRLLREEPDRYFYQEILKGVDLSLPLEIEAGVSNVSKRENWNRPADDTYGLPTETWREHVSRRTRCNEVRAKLAAGDITSINDVITYNLNIQQFAQDVIERSEGPELLRAFWKIIKQISVLDPTCGSGAFLFAALNILDPLYEACLERMQAFVDEADRSLESYSARKFPDFREVLADVARHPNRRYFILKSIIINNLYGVDIMEEAVEIARLRLFLKLVAQVEDASKIEPLPDIDFNIRAGNTLVGYATYAEVQRAVTSKFDWDDAMGRIDQKASDLDQQFDRFREKQTMHGGIISQADKDELHRRLDELNKELNSYLATEYKIEPIDTIALEQWRKSHQPFHWFIEFYGIVHKHGGFDVIIGNPPYVEYGKVKQQYTIQDFTLESCGNLYAFAVERSFQLLASSGRFGMIVPISLVAAQRMSILQKFLISRSSILHLANFGLRPAALFQGIMQRLCVCISTRGENGKIYSTDYKTWYSMEREILFQKIWYEEVTSLIQEYCIPKIDSPLASEILDKMLQLPRRTIDTLAPGIKPIYYHNAGGYWIKAFDFKPIYKTTQEEGKQHTTISSFSVATSQLQAVILAVLNSTLFYFFWKSLTDARHIYPSDIAMFPINWNLDENLAKKLDHLVSVLMKDLDANSTIIKYGKATVQKFNVAKSKPIIDEIDTVLAQHYGFTDEELDFIINYDIKYRMGQNGDDGDDEA